MRVSLGYPDAASERRLLRGGRAARACSRGSPRCSGPAAMLRMQQAVRAVHIADAAAGLRAGLVAHTRERAGPQARALTARRRRACCAQRRRFAFIAERDAVLPEDVQAVLPAVVAHRLERRDDRLPARRGPGARDHRRRAGARVATVAVSVRQPALHRWRSPFSRAERAASAAHGRLDASARAGRPLPVDAAAPPALHPAHARRHGLRGAAAADAARRPQLRQQPRAASSPSCWPALRWWPCSSVTATSWA